MAMTRKSPRRSRRWIVLARLRENEDGDARLFVELNRGQTVYDHAAGKWYEFIGHSYQEDLLDQATAKVEGVISVYGQTAQREAWLRLQAEKSGNQAKAKKHEGNENELYKRIRALQSVRRKTDVLILARSGRESLAITGQEWDADPWLLGCRNGVLQLKADAFVFRPGDPGDFIKKPTPTEWRGLHEPGADLGTVFK